MKALLLGGALLALAGCAAPGALTAPVASDRLATALAAHAQPGAARAAQHALWGEPLTRLLDGR